LKIKKIFLVVIFIVIILSWANYAFAIENLNTIENIIVNDVIQESSGNTNLSILRLDREGLTPAFNPIEKEYYLVIDTSVVDIDITALPENENAIITITGNTNLVLGKNTIIIKVENEDESSEYKIYVTKTDDLEAANANLETLAIKEGTLAPEFDFNITKYYAEVSNNISKLELLAIPQSQQAIVNILGDENLSVGDNKIEVEVMAENKITTKKYEIIVHRRNNEEENKNTEEQIIAKRIVANIQKNQIGNKNTEENMKNDYRWIIFVGVVLVVGIGRLVFKRIKK